jgi:hypothetical protein
VRSLDGLMGSTDPDDVKALGALVRLATAEDRAEDARLGHAVDQLAAEATPRLAGAALVARLHLGRVDGAEVGRMLGGHIFLAASDASRHDLGERLGGALGALGPDRHFTQSELQIEPQAHHRLPHRAWANGRG